VRRFTAYLIWAGFLTALHQGAIELVVDWLIGWLL